MSHDNYLHALIECHANECVLPHYCNYFGLRPVWCYSCTKEKSENNVVSLFSHGEILNHSIPGEQTWKFTSLGGGGGQILLQPYFTQKFPWGHEGISFSKLGLTGCPFQIQSPETNRFVSSVHPCCEKNKQCCLLVHRRDLNRVSDLKSSFQTKNTLFL